MPENPKVCLSQPQAGGEPKALCGRARMGVDIITEDPEKVTCKDCTKWIKEGILASATPRPAAPPPAANDPLTVLAGMTADAIDERIKKCRGELAALRVLRDALKAREKAEKGKDI